MLYNYQNVTRALRATAIVLVCGFLSVFPGTVLYAENGELSLTIAPPLFQINLQPGETWSSGITVVNNNRYDITLFANPVLFEPRGESGTPVFLRPSLSNDGTFATDESTLAGWITVPQTGFTIPSEQTYVLPISIKVPEGAAPGGHYAAVLIGNRAPEGNSKESTVNVTSSIASLIFLSVAGDVVEKGWVREFSTERSVYQNASARFSLRFENQGNVHLVPQGNIVIYNMFGKQRGVIPVNQNQNYGSVLPGSVRKYDFTWESDAGIWDIGRYKAEATISYGKDRRQNALSTIYFYVLPVVPLLEIVGSFIGFVLFIGWALRAYIRRALKIEAAYLEQSKQVYSSNEEVTSVQTQPVVMAQPRIGITTLIKPIQVGLVDLRKTTTGVGNVNDDRAEFEMRLVRERQRTSQNVGLLGFVVQYKLFFVFIIILSLSIFALNVYFDDVMTVNREYSVTEYRSDGTAIEITDSSTNPVD